MPELVLSDPAERDDLGAFVARAVRLDQQVVVRLRARPASDGPESRIDAWVTTPFDVLVTRSVRGTIEPRDVTVSGNELLAALAVMRGDRLDPGPARDLMWHSGIPPVSGWLPVDDLPASVVATLAERGAELANENRGPHGTPPATLMDQPVLTVSGSGFDIKVPMRCLFALSGMGFLGATTGEEIVRVTATDSWLRIDARYGAVVRTRRAMLPLLV